MKKLIAFLVLIAAALPAYAFDYNAGQCPVLGPISVVDGTAGPGTCGGNSGPTRGAFSDTVTFFIGNWQESYGTWTYSGSTGVAVRGEKACYRCPSAVTITSATIDGMPMNPPAAGSLIWTYPVDLLPGQHVIAVTGTETGVNVGYWFWGADSIMYVLVPPAPPPGGGDD